MVQQIEGLTAQHQVLTFTDFELPRNDQVERQEAGPSRLFAT